MCRLKQRRNRAVWCDKTKCKCSISLWSLWLRLAVEMSNAHRVGFSCFNGIASTENHTLAGRSLFFGRTGNLILKVQLEIDAPIFFFVFKMLLKWTIPSARRGESPEFSFYCWCICEICRYLLKLAGRPDFRCEQKILIKGRKENVRTLWACNCSNSPDLLIPFMLKSNLIQWNRLEFFFLV